MALIFANSTPRTLDFSAKISFTYLVERRSFDEYRLFDMEVKMTMTWRKLLSEAAIALGIVIFLWFVIKPGVISLIITSKKPTVSVGETLTMEPEQDAFLTPMGSEKKCLVGSGGIIVVLAQRDDYVLVQCLNSGEPWMGLSCPINTKAVMTKDDFSLQRLTQVHQRKLNEEENKRRAAEKLFQSEK